MKRSLAFLVPLTLLAAICACTTTHYPDVQSVTTPSLLAAPQPGETSTTRYPDAQRVTTCRVTVDAMSSLTQNLTIPEHLREGYATKTGGEFDVNTYFSVLRALSMEPSYTLDYVYSYGGNQGFPLLYARPANQPPYPSFLEYKEATGIPDHWFSTRYAYRYVDYLHNYLQHVQIKDTADGYFQFVVLLTMSDQFYLYWHSEYHDERIICDSNRLETLSATLQKADQPLPADVEQAARAASYTPTVELLDDTAIVRVVVFTKWGGVIEKVYTISRDFPHSIIDWEFKTLVPYDCGIII